MFYTKPIQKKKSVSYGSWEKEKFLNMEQVLMKHFGYNYSQLVKVLIREKYYALKEVL